MAVFDSLSRFITGRGVADRSEQRKLEHFYDDTETLIKTMDKIFTTSHPNNSVAKGSLSSNQSNPTTRETKSPAPSIPLSRHERCVSSSTLPSITAFKSPSGPPDITARDLTEEDLRRNYSSDNIWNPVTQPLPPMPQMSGFGRYRHSVDADTQWRMERLNKNLRDLRGLAFVDPSTCAPSDLYPYSSNQDKHHHIRATSFTSSESSDSDRPQCNPAYYLDQAGTRISRGFYPSAPSSANSSYKDGLGNYRRDCGNSHPNATSPSTDGELRFVRRSARATPLTHASRHTSRHASTTSMSALAAIDEHQEGGILLRKYEGPCEIHEAGNTESALASDDEDQGWTDMVIGGGQRVSNLTKQLRKTSLYQKEDLKRPQVTRRRTTSDERQGVIIGKEAAVERSRPVRTTSRTANRRISHRRQESKRYFSQDQGAKLQGNRQRAQAFDHTVADDSSHPSTLSNSTNKHRPEIQHTIEGVKVSTTGSHPNASNTPSPHSGPGPFVCSTRSDTSQETLFMTKNDKHEVQSPTHHRQRSDTVTTIRPVKDQVKPQTTIRTDKISE